MSLSSLPHPGGSRPEPCSSSAKVVCEHIINLSAVCEEYLRVGRSFSKSMQLFGSLWTGREHIVRLNFECERFLKLANGFPKRRK